MKSRDLSDGGRQAILELPEAQANAFARPHGCPDAVVIGSNCQTPPWEVQTTEIQLSQRFLARRRHRAALDCRPLSEVMENQKNT